MLNQYMDERDNNVKKEEEDDDSNNMALISTGNRNDGPAEIILSNTEMNDEAMDGEQAFEEKSASSWSLSFTHLGLSLQAAVHNVLELENFLKDISGGIFRGFDATSADNSDHDSYSDEELDDSEYLVTIPVCRFSNLVSNTLIDQEMDTEFVDEEPRFTNLPFNLFHEHTDWKRRIAQKYPPHVVLLVEALESFITKDTHETSDNVASDSTTSEFVYLAAATIIFASNDEGENPADERALAEQYCVSATNILFENTFSDIETNEWLPIIQAILVLGWYEFVSKRCLIRARQLVVFAIRVFLIYQSQRNPPSREWQIAVMSLVYLDVLSSACMNRRTLLDGDNVANISRQLLVKTGSPEVPDYFAESLYMEFQSIRLLRQVIRTFYAIDDNEMKRDLVAKVDVDEVLNLVKDVEKWETDISPWAFFDSDEDLASLDDELSTIMARCKLHAHALHNVVKVLLFRPFCTDFQRYEDQNEDNDSDTRFDQTHTHTTFLDLSLESAMKIARCHRVLSTDDFILVIGKSLVEDVIVRVRRAFESDEDMMRSIKLLETTISTH
jgi:hypothetical protein